MSKRARERKSRVGGGWADRIEEIKGEAQSGSFRVHNKDRMVHWRMSSSLSFGLCYNLFLPSFSSRLIRHEKTKKWPDDEVAISSSGIDSHHLSPSSHWQSSGNVALDGTSNNLTTFFPVAVAVAVVDDGNSSWN